MCVGFSPSLLLVTGMLWTVRSLKQELVRTWSSTELNTHAWTSEKHTTTAQLQSDLHFVMERTASPKNGNSQFNNYIRGQSYLSFEVSGCFPSTLTSHSQRTGGTGSSGYTQENTVSNPLHSWK